MRTELIGMFLAPVYIKLRVMPTKGIKAPTFFLLSDSWQQS
ncbi:hypothetical protein VCRA2119O147_40082 [Vibrio crassostreae]|nr:hypothetical protein VCRA2113O137_100081 [Vibrio crassostreae]CAK1700647.1 hypothetical protein VCRA2113O20_100092 [Vibrio crassostreae]CAK1701739.1 hypothetical protein VCRA2117O40_100093 [Vibrio crassostreae]CAK1701872.1 hypothetical protein VCRA2117O39_100090 [Vibrio crassostreae]CAK1701894.1 hypothetical protein VCRA2113O22_100091 [Vibrio crassostreae]